MSNVYDPLLAIALPVILGAVTGSLVSSKGMSFYNSLPQLAWSPPSWVFGFVWTILYISLVVAGWLVYVKTEGALRQKFLLAFYLQVLLNFLWVQVFFGWKNPNLALVVIVLLLVNVFILAWMTWKVSTTASVIFWVYLAWIIFALTLNVGIVVKRQ